MTGRGWSGTVKTLSAGTGPDPVVERLAEVTFCGGEARTKAPVAVHLRSLVRKRNRGGKVGLASSDSRSSDTLQYLP
ncbi:hypothetical protein FRC10_007839 [Ceratobasidium sp. 414]|nr:hypothetical protein FRC10_007839 [Ceratobasidium sp. 414]